MRVALIGKPLGHSYSKAIHERFGYPYELLEVDEGNVANLLREGGYDGFNVTIPYKKMVIPLLDEIDEKAMEIGAVNTVCVRNRRLIGYNTDFYGLDYLLESNGVDVKDKVVMVLGAGGTSQTAKAVLNSRGAKRIVTVGRREKVNYDNCYNEKGVSVIINTTPVGMYPNVGESPIEVGKFSGLEWVVDVVYNPFRTKLVVDALSRGVKAVGGLKMLVAQAVYASNLFTGSQYGEEDIEKAYIDLLLEKTNLALVGMPSSGKTTLGRELARLLGKQFVDIDEEIVKLAGKSIPEIFSAQGEEFFRFLEADVLKEAFEGVGKIISTGGGSVFREENRRAMLSNSVIIHVKRGVEKLSQEGRPLSSSVERLKEMERERMPIYCDLADFSIDNNGDIQDAFNKLKGAQV